MKKTLNKLLPKAQANLLFLFSILIFTVGLNFQDKPPSGWYQQFLPNLNGRQITDITFLDSLTGWAVTNATNQNPDTTFVLKTTNGGDNWVIQYGKIQTGGGFPGYFRVYFLNQSTGYTCGVKGLDKTTNGGVSWISLNAPLNSYLDMSVLNTDSIWLVSSNSLTGGVFRTTNGGTSWQQQLSLGSQNPTHIYFYNRNIGFIANNTGSPYVRKTTDGGASWSVIVNEGFKDLYFIDSLKGWRSNDYMKETTDGGFTWVEQTLPQGGFIVLSSIVKFSSVNRDSIWGVGSVGIVGTGGRGLIYLTTNGGNNWGYQLPDTSINIFRYYYTHFTDTHHGWAYSVNNGVHTVTGGDDTTYYMKMTPISTEIPGEYRLHQNYPNPFNYSTRIKFDVSKNSDVKLKVYNLLGKEVDEIVNSKVSAGSYDFKFIGSELSSGVYLCRLVVDDNKIDTKKMILIK